MGWSGLAALGEMAKGAGGYFGTLHSEKVKNERLAQARSEKVADRDEKRRYDESVHDADVVRSEQTRDERRAYEEGLARKARAEKLADQKSGDEEWRERQVILAANKAGGGSGGGAKNASQVTHETRTGQAEVALAELDDIMTRYDPGSAQGGWDQLMVGGMTNFLASEDGKQYQSAAGRVKESFLRAATGAAAPETENKAYVNMFIPQFGDGPETKAAKRQAMIEQINIMQSAYDDSVPRDVRLAQFEQNAHKMIQKHGLDKVVEAQAAATEAAEFKPYQDERGNWVKTPPGEDISVDDLLNKYLN